MTDIKPWLPFHPLLPISFEKASLFSRPVFLCFLIGLVASISACSTGSRRSPVVTPQHLLCESILPAEVIFLSPDEAALIFQEKKYHLKRVMTDSGIRYDNKEISFWKKGIDSMILPKDGTSFRCTDVPKQGL